MIGCPTWDQATEFPLPDGGNVWHLKSRSGTPRVRSVRAPHGLGLFEIVFTAMVDIATIDAIHQAMNP